MPYSICQPSTGCMSFATAALWRAAALPGSSLPRWLLSAVMLTVVITHLPPFSLPVSDRISGIVQARMGHMCIVLDGLLFGSSEQVILKCHFFAIKGVKGGLFELLRGRTWLFSKPVFGCPQSSWTEPPSPGGSSPFQPAPFPDGQLEP